MTLNTACRIAVVLTCTLMPAASHQGKHPPMSLPRLHRRRQRSRRRSRRNAKPTARRPRSLAVLIEVWDGAGGSYVHGFGDADLATHRAMTPADHIRIGSNTKTFVISVVLQLVDEGKLHLDDPLSRFSLGVTIPNAEHITVAELCQMRSGLFEAFRFARVQTHEARARHEV